MTMKGGLGPDLNAKRLNTLPRELLFNTIANGRKDTPMPPWSSLLTEQEINWLLDQLLEDIDA
jgi:cytochrome c55X